MQKRGKRSIIMNKRFKSIGPVFFKNLGHLIGGSAIAQLLMIAAAPFLASVYSPKQFGIYAGYFALSSILVSFSSLRLDVLIPFVGSLKKMTAFLQACLIGPLIICIFFLSLSLCTPVDLIEFLGMDGSQTKKALMVSVMCLSIAGMISIKSLAVRLGKFNIIGKAQIMRIACIIVVSYLLATSE